MRIGRGYICGLVILLFLPLQLAFANEIQDLRKATFTSLDHVSEAKYRQLTVYLDHLTNLAESVSEDPVMLHYLSIKKRYWELQKEQPAPPEALDAIKTLRSTMIDHYLRNYLSFYDILFVDKSGYVLSAVRQQADYHQNLFEGEQSETALAKHLIKKPGASFVDYEFYGASDEPSAFFVEPVMDGDQLKGWFVMQCAINRINTIFTRREELGKTGEVFLVNRKHQMLTESHLDMGAGNLNSYLSKENIESKFEERQGHKRVIDYRGHVALSSFSVCRVMDSEWLLIAKIDEDEVITRHYLENFSRLQPELDLALANTSQLQSQGRKFPQKVCIVDMDEFRRSNDIPLITFGVSTCTAIVVSLEKEKAYMAHASSLDRIYGAGDLDLMDHMLRRIGRFEIYPYQLRLLDVVVVSPHLNSVNGTIKKLLETGILLSQIRFIYNPRAECATVFHDVLKGETTVQWMMGQGQEYRWECSKDAQNLGEVIEEIIGLS